jgi:hypothetical protein
MFKYIILIRFHSFTRYYKNEKKYYLMLYLRAIFLFLCALSIKNVGLLSGAKLHRVPPQIICSAFFYFGKTIRSSGTGHRR